VGLELEGMIAFADTKDGGGATAYGARGDLIGQLPIGRIIPFVALGMGWMGAKSSAMGNDADFGPNYGAGIKYRLLPYLDLRADFRNTQTQSDSDKQGRQAHHQEYLIGASYILNFKKKEEAPKDTDGDGFYDPSDKCPTVPGVAPDGCPPPDTDKDGFLDPVDKCPTEPGIAPDGCPDRDPDKDGFLNPDDQCPTVPGVAPDGCPDKDPDKDGILNPDDKCPNDPETKNGYEDTDGCPDEIPEVVQKFTGVIQGIEFDFGKATIRARSKPRLDEAAQVLIDHPSLRIEISGHTDNVGTAERNKQLSGDRANSVRDYLASKGVDASRITTRGAGPDEPVAENKTAAGRQKNRRIEFKILIE
jgi:OOP family OmpA-OmpF porin